MRLTDIIKTAADYEDAVDLLDAMSTPEPNTGCSLWFGGSTNGGYGMVRIGWAVVGVHRLSYLLFIDHIPDDMVVRHRCDQPACVNPMHLIIGTQKQNMEDKYRRGRQNQGGHGHGKLSTAQRAAIRDTRVDEQPTMESIAEQYGVTRQAISLVLRTRT